MRTKAKLKGWMAVAVSLLVFSTAVAAPAPADASVAAPKGVVGQDNGGEVLITWEAVTGAAGYNVYRNNDYVATEHDLDFVESVGEGTYSYYVTAFDAGGENYSPRSDETTVTVGADSINPTPSDPTPSESPAAEEEAGRSAEPTEEREAPTGELGAPTVHQAIWGGQSVQVSWTFDDPRVAGFNVYRDDQYIATTDREKAVLIDTSGLHTSTYYVVAFDEGGKNFSPRSNEVAAVRSTTQLPSPMIAEVAAGAKGVYLTVRDTTHPRIHGLNIYRNGDFVGSMSEGTDFADQDGRVGDSYYAIAYDIGGVTYSDPSRTVRATPLLRGTPHYVFAHALTDIAPSEADDSELLKTHLSALFREFDPSLNDATSRGSQAAQREQNLGIAAAILNWHQPATNNHHRSINFYAALRNRIMDGLPNHYYGSTADDRLFWNQWNSATQADRLRYLGIDADLWSTALPFIEAAVYNEDNFQALRDAKRKFIEGAILGLIASALTVGMLPPGTSVFVRGAVAGAVGSGTTTLYVTGDLNEAIENAAQGALVGGIGGWVSELDGLNKILGKVLLASATAAAKGEDAEDAALQALVSALTGKAIEAVEGQITVETATQALGQELAPVVGMAMTNKIVNFAANSAPSMMAELTVLYALDPSIDVEAEANRILLSHVARLTGDEAADLIEPVSVHLGDVVGAMITAGITSDWDRDKVEEAAAKSLATPAAALLDAHSAGRPHSFLEFLTIAVLEEYGGGDDTPHADIVKEWVVQFLNDSFGLELEA